MTGRKRDVWNLCQHDEYLPQLVRDFGMEGALVGIEVEANGERAEWFDDEALRRMREAGL